MGQPHDLVEIFADLGCFQLCGKGEREETREQKNQEPGFASSATRHNHLRLFEGNDVIAEAERSIFLGDRAYLFNAAPRCQADSKHGWQTGQARGLAPT
jgi:hypothetical protein